MLCAEELAPVELDAGPYETMNTNIRLTKDVNNSPFTMSLPPDSRSRRSSPLSAAPPTTLESSDEDSKKTAGNPTQTLSDPVSISRPPVLGVLPLNGIDSSSTSVKTRLPESQTTRLSLTCTAPHVSSVPAGTMTLTMPSASHKAADTAPLVPTLFAHQPSQGTAVSGRSVDDIQAMPSSLQAHKPSGNRVRSRSATYEPWHPPIQFVQDGTLQESKVSTPMSSGLSDLQQQDTTLTFAVDTRMSAWLSEQALGRPLPDTNKIAGSQNPYSGNALSKATESAQQQDHDQYGTSTKPGPSDINSGSVDPTSIPLPLFSIRKPQNHTLTGHGDRVVESIIDIPALDRRGVQLIDVAPGFRRSGIARRGAVKKKRFSWENETDITSDEQLTIAEASTPSPHSGPSSPACGQIAQNRVVLVEPTEERKASTVAFETGPRKPLPPQLVPRGHTNRNATAQQPKPNAFEQMSELIAVANAAMPSARPLSALPVGPTAESIWRSLRTHASRSASSPGLMDNLSGSPSAATLNMPDRPVGHSRSVSQLSGLATSLQPPKIHHSRSQSLISPLEFSSNHSHPSGDGDRLSPASRDGNTVWPRPGMIPAPTDGHKSHKRLSIHLTPVGTFPYHPLRSSPVLAPTIAGSPEIEEPCAVDELKKLPSAQQLKPNRNRAPSSSRAERPRLQVKTPFIGLPSSPRPIPRPESDRNLESTAKLGVDGSNEESIEDESNTIEQTQRRPSTQSQVSSPTSSIFSTIRDSAVSAVSSLSDINSAPLSDLTEDPVAMDKNQAQRTQQSQLLTSESKEGARNQMPADINEAHLAPSFISASSMPAARNEVPQTLTEADISVRRPPNVPEAIRPAGTRASMWGTSKTEGHLAVQTTIPTVIVRAPTVKLRPPERQEIRESQPPISHIPELPLEASKTGAPYSVEQIEAPARPAIEIVQSHGDDDDEQQNVPQEKPQGFMKSLRQSWQSTLSNTSRLSLLPGQGHRRSNSQSNLPGPQEKLAEASDTEKKQASMPWQWTDRDNWPDRDSIPVDTRSISNVGAAIRFFNSSFQARRPKSQTIVQPVPELSRPDFKNDAGMSTIVVRKVGPPVVVRKPW